MLRKSREKREGGVAERFTPFLKKLTFNYFLNYVNIVSSKQKSIYKNNPQNKKNINSKGYMHLYAYCSIIYNSQIVEAAEVATDR